MLGFYFMENNSIQNKDFISDKDGKIFSIPFAISPSVDLDETAKLPKLTPEAEKEMQQHFDRLNKSSLNLGGIGIIFGTFDNLHLGHKIMLNTAKAMCSELYIGIEDQRIALERKRNKHPILPNEDRIKQLVDENITTESKAFIRGNALLDIKRLQAKGKKITTLFVGETQKDNPEMVAAVEYCYKNRIQVVAITRMKPRNNSMEISSSSLHKMNLAKTLEGK